MEDFWVRITSIVGPQAEAISKAPKDTGIIMYHDHSIPGVKILDVYTDKDEMHCEDED